MFDLPFPPSPLMPDVDSFSPKTTSVNYPWPKGVTGIERVALTAQGDLQRVLSAFFTRPIDVAVLNSKTSHLSPTSSLPEIITQPTPSLIASASASSPIIQNRCVNLWCGGKVVCKATSTVYITSPEIAHLFLHEKYAIGQMFRRLGKVPAFELIDVGLGDVDGGEKNKEFDSKNRLWRKYTLTIPHFKCEILEEFPDRQMFVDGERWLTDLNSSPTHNPIPELLRQTGNIDSAVSQSIKPVVVGVLLLMASFETWRSFWGRSVC